jgi:NitT/TauT family transport system substrate-binding protein
MRTMLSRRVVLGSMLGVALAGCAGKAGSTGTAGSAAPSVGLDGVTLRRVAVGVIPIIDVAPLYLGVQKGFFATRGLDVVPALAQGGAAIVKSVLAGEAQFGFSNVVSLLSAREKGAPLVSVAAGVSSTGDPAKDVNAVLVGKRSPLKTARDLEGKKVAINTKSNIGDTTIKNAVQKAGGDPSTITFVEVPFPEMPARLSSGLVDAVWESEPFRTQILMAGGRILFDNLTETYPRVQIAQYFTSEQTRQKNPELVSDFVQALNESMSFASTHQELVRAILPSYTSIAPQVTAQMVLPLWTTKLDRASTTALGAAAHAFGTLVKAPDVAGLLGG